MLSAILDNHLINSVEDAIEHIEVGDDFIIEDILAYLYEIYGGPFSKKLFNINDFSLQILIENEFCGAASKDKLVSVLYEYLVDGDMLFTRIL